MNLKTLFAYDLWANLQWVDTVEASRTLPNGARFAAEAERWLGHIASASRIWLSRICGEELPPKSTLVDDFRIWTDRWTSELEKRQTEEVIQYTKFDGTPCSSLLNEIALHVINHGTYHRGQIRAMAESAEIPFPETDLILYTRSVI